MKKLIVITLFIIGCSSNNDTQIGINKELAKENIEKYINANSEFDENSHLDEIIIMKFDTLTEKDVLNVKYNNISFQYKNEIEITQNEQDILNSYKGLEFDDDMIDHQMKKVKTALEKAQFSDSELNEIDSLLPISDSLMFKCYITKVKMDYTEKAAAKSMELEIYLNSKMQVVQWIDL